MTDGLVAGPSSLRVDLHPAGQPWFPGPTPELPGAEWVARARRVIAGRVAERLTAHGALSATPYARGVIERLGTIAPGEPRHRLVRWLDLGELPVLLEATAWEPAPAPLLRTRLAGDAVPLDERVDSRPDGTVLLRMVLPAREVEEASPAPVELRFLVEVPGAPGVLAAAATVPADQVGDLLPELEAILLAGEVRDSTDPVPDRVRRARRLRPVGSGWRTLVPVLLALGLALVVPYALALSAPSGAGWEEMLRLRPVDRARGITSGLLVAALLAHLVSLWRDRHLFRERRSRDFSDYLAVGGVSTLVAGAVGSLAVWLAGATMVVAAIVLRVTGRRPGTPPDRLLRETWVSLAVLGAATGWGLGELPQSRAGWELGFGAPGLDDRAAELGLPWVETASVVSLNLLALVAVALLWRHRTAVQSRSLPLVLLLVVPVFAAWDVWVALGALPVVLWMLVRRRRPTPD